MIKDIEISNFRCFEHTKIEGFERVNLIGGKNNSGKTALLEALIVADKPENILFLRYLRREPIKIHQALPKQTFENLFFRQNQPQEMLIKTQNENKQETENRIIFSENISEELSRSTKIFGLFGGLDLLWDFIEGESYFPKGIIPTLRFNIIDKFSEKSEEFIIIATPKNYLNISLNGQYIKPFDYSSESVKNMPIITTSMGEINADLVEDYELIVFQGKKNEVLNSIRILDPCIENVESFYLGSPSLYLTRKGENRLPISLFGDAINRLVQIIMKLKESSILLIDEIENGIHYTNQREFWKTLFRLAIELDSQIFATTHSLEMIQAFADVGLEYYPEDGAYFELARSPRTDKIIGIKSELDILDYALKHNDRIRGETE
ncbi:ATP/GTP phosphatase [Microcystis aeruginosa NIES-1211]|uniref:AAA family ATPase n=1 Tax=Microcystis TaxID=1125 RepID=UPI000D7D1D67|nr:ATP-binding protein [Microcystis aeruginosa]GBL12752.1 ATP/GTP phosphatase [Microcystis aeruginosa NIES-1211]